MANKMRRGKQFLTLLLAAAVALSAVTAAAAGTGEVQEALFDLRALGILETQPETEPDPAKEVTRAEFAHLVVGLMNMQTAAASVIPMFRFEDVPDSHPRRGDIELLAILNLISGTDSVHFEPDAPVTLPQACKILTAALGYTVQVSELGGYPAGCLTVAARLQLLPERAVSEEPLTWGDTVVMAANALDADRMVRDGDTYRTDPGNTFRKQFASGQRAGLSKQTGTVTATADIWLLSPMEDMTDQQIQIDGMLYDLADPAGSAYIGQQVDFYLYTDESAGVRRVERMRPTDQNTVTVFAAEDLEAAADGSLEYYMEKDQSRKRRVTLSPMVTLVRNRQTEIKWTPGDLNQLENGTITLIDNDGDQRIDVILAEEYESVVVENVVDPEAVVYFKNTFTLAGQNSLRLAPDDPDIFVRLYDAEGNPAEPSAVKEGDVLTVSVSTDGTRVTGRISGRRAEGRVTARGEKTVTIGETVYETEKEEYLDRFTPGKEVTAYLSVYDEIVYMEERGADTFGYILDTAENGSFGTDCMARVLFADKLNEKIEEVENEEGGEPTTIAVLSCRNESIQELMLASKVSLVTWDGESEITSRLTAAEAAKRIKGSAFRLELNSAGEITKLTALRSIGGKGSRLYNTYERTFGGSRVGVGFGVDENTRTICIPKAPEDNPGYVPETDDYLVRVEMNNGQNYSVTGYEKNEVTKAAELVVVEISMIAGSVGILSSKSDVGMVNQAEKSLREDGTEGYTFTVMTDEKEKVLVTSPYVSENIPDKTEFASICQGDLIEYSLDSEDRIDACRVLGRISELSVPDLTQEGKEYETFYGYLVDAEYDEVSAKLNRWIHKLTVGYSPEGSAVRAAYEVPRTNGPPVFIYYKNQKQAELGTVKQIRAGADEIFVAAASNAVRAIVVIR